MARGSSSNIRTTVLVLLIGLICLTAVVRGAEWVVGDDKGWSLRVNDTFPGGRPIHAGDTLVFKYNPNFHDVVKVDEGSYNSCRVPNGVPRYKSGNDHIRIPHCKTDACKSFFICSVAAHCNDGMKVAIATE